MGTRAIMNAILRIALAGAAGSLTTNLLHEVTRRLTPQAPRIDALGMQAVAKSARDLDLQPPTGTGLYRLTLAGDLISNAAYFALAAIAPRRLGGWTATVLGLTAGIGAVVLPPRLGLSARTTNLTSLTRALTVGLYTAGGLVCGLVLSRTARGAGLSEYFRAKHVVISGGTRGLGFTLAKELLAAGANVTIAGRSADTLATALASLDAGGSVFGMPSDVRRQHAAEELITRSVERFGPVDILINNAAVIEVGPFRAQTIDDFSEAMDTHFWAPLFLTLAVLPSMRSRRSGSIVNIASVGGLIGIPHLAPYSASKFAQVGLTQAIAGELAADGVTVTSVTPGLMITGSPDHAIFKGNNRAEYAWFTLSDANPLISVPVEKAARRILRAICDGEAQATIGWTAAVAKTVNALFPETTAAMLRFAAGLLPAPNGSTARTDGADSRSGRTDNPLTALNDAAMKRTNQ